MQITARPNQSYTIHRGDSLWAIASRLKSQGAGGSILQLIAQIKKLNPSVKGNLIHPGQGLKLPGQVSGGSDGFSPAKAAPPSGAPAPMGPVPNLADAKNADEYRAKVAEWAAQQANDPNIGYSKIGRFGERTDSKGHRFFDCSGLVFSAYKQAGVTLGGNWTGAMRSTWPSWAEQVPKKADAMKAGDLILMNGHVVMYLGNGKCVGAQTSHTNFQDQVTTNINVQTYLARPDAIVLRPKVPAGLVD